LTLDSSSFESGHLIIADFPLMLGKNSFKFSIFDYYTIHIVISSSLLLPCGLGTAAWQNGSSTQLAWIIWACGNLTSAIASMTVHGMPSDESCWDTVIHAGTWWFTMNGHVHSQT
jgi:hypothetical protein